MVCPTGGVGGGGGWWLKGTGSTIHIYPVNLLCLDVNLLTANYFICLLPTGSEERKVFGVGSIPVKILPSCQDMKTIAL